MFVHWFGRGLRRIRGVVVWVLYLRPGPFNRHLILERVRLDQASIGRRQLHQFSCIGNIQLKFDRARFIWLVWFEGKSTEHLYVLLKFVKDWQWSVRYDAAECAWHNEQLPFVTNGPKQGQPVQQTLTQLWQLSNIAFSFFNYCVTTS